MGIEQAGCRVARSCFAPAGCWGREGPLAARKL